MKLLPYTFLTMIGIAPTTFFFLTVGQFYGGSKQDIIQIIEQSQWMVVMIIVIAAILYLWKKRRVACH
ncbi:hypothetical protein [Bacillus sp. CGMCC 1.16541]|uniref:hypothetical protein n=1 Tax=Bacillus sp. CGMCC 1.16541 TaxID=2185143 RepID=UPI0013A5333A|nr:hypothetical protein [Bacillus sp. CGMCC 1.16541]